MSQELATLQSKDQELTNRVNALVATKVALEQTCSDITKMSVELRTQLLLVSAQAKQLQEKLAILEKEKIKE